MVDLNERRYPNKVVDKLLNDVRLNEVEGKLVPFDRCKYENGKELHIWGIDFVYTIVSTNKFVLPFTHGLSFWCEDGCDKIYVKRHIVNEEIKIFDKKNTDEVVEYLIEIVFNLNSRDNYRRVII